MRRAALVVTVLMGSIVGFSPAYGQPVRNSLDPSVQAAEADNLQQALEKNKTNQASKWVNPDTRDSGTATPVRTFRTADGTNCREFVETITIGGRQEQGYGTACRQPDGSWRIVGNPAAVPPARTTTQRIERYYIVQPPAYPPAYYYPQPWGYYSPSYYPYYNPYPGAFSFSFGYIYHDYDGHSGGHHHDGGHGGSGWGNGGKGWHR